MQYNNFDFSKNCAAGVVLESASGKSDLALLWTDTVHSDNLWNPSLSFNSVEMNKVDMRYERASGLSKANETDNSNRL